MIQPYAIGVCSWSLQVKSVPELRGFLDELGVNVIQIACGDPHHASWNEGDDMPAAALAAGFDIHAAMIGFPGEDYTTPQTIKETGGFGNPATRAARLETLKWALTRTTALGVDRLMMHGGFIPDPKTMGGRPSLTRSARPRRSRRRTGSPSASRPARRRPTCCVARSTT